MNWYKISQKLWGKAGSGILFICLEDQSALLLLRSEEVEDPNQWGIPGGAIKGESYYSQDELKDVEEYDEQITWNSAMKETMEELGYFPSQFQRLGTTKFNKENFVYTTFIVSIPLDKKKKMEELVRLNWEHIDAQWFPLQSIMNMNNLHPGVQFTLNNYKIASPVMEKSDFDESGNPNYPNYYEIGHNEYEGMNIEGCKDYMWIFVYGKLEVYPAEFHQTHGRVIPKGKMSNATFSGRVTQCKEKTEISLHPRTLMSRYKDIPNVVISQLYDRFGTNAQIYII